MKFHCALAAVGLVFSAAVSAGDCRYIVELSKVNTSTVQDANSLQQEAAAFCSEYASAKASGKSLSGGGSYAGIGLSAASSSSDMEQASSKYCSSSNKSAARADAYRQYVEAIAPGTYQALEKCLSLQESGIEIAVDKNATLKNYYAISVSFKSQDARATQDITYAASNDVSCEWNSAGKSRKLTLTPHTADALICRRTKATVQSAIHVIPLTKANTQLSFIWDRYEGNLPAEELKRLQAKVDASATALQTAADSLRASVVSFAAASCPEGWKEYEPAYGRFVRGIDKKMVTDPDGQRVPGDLKDDLFKSHSHTRPQDVYDFGSITVGSVPGGHDLGYTYDAAHPAPPTGDAGGTETRPKSVALLYCSRA